MKMASVRTVLGLRLLDMQTDVDGDLGAVAPRIPYAFLAGSGLMAQGSRRTLLTGCGGQRPVSLARDAAVLEQEHPVGARPDELCVVSRGQNRAAARDEPAHRARQLRPPLAVERGRRLIEQQ